MKYIKINVEKYIFTYARRTCVTCDGQGMVVEGNSYVPCPTCHGECTVETSI